MALERTDKTEHNGAKNMSHDKPVKRAFLKDASRKHRREQGKRLAHDQPDEEGPDQ